MWMYKLYNIILCVDSVCVFELVQTRHSFYASVCASRSQIWPKLSSVSVTGTLPDPGPHQFVCTDWQVQPLNLPSPPVLRLHAWAAMPGFNVDAGVWSWVLMYMQRCTLYPLSHLPNSQLCNFKRTSAIKVDLPEAEGKIEICAEVIYE